MVDDPARSGTLLEVVLMRYTKLQMPSWKTGVLKIIHAIPIEKICDALMLVLVLVVFVIMLVLPIWLSLLMPTAS